MKEIIKLILSGMIGGLAVLLTPLIRRFFWGPKLQLLFEEKGEGFVVKTPISIKSSGSPMVNITEGYYIRIMIKNIKPIIAKECRAFLINIEKQDEDNIFKQTIYCDSIQLQWSTRPEKGFDSIDIPMGINQFVDVIQTTNGDPFFTCKIGTFPFRYHNLFQDVGIFRFTIQVAGNDIIPQFTKIIFHWKGEWNNFEVYLNNK
jgi:hypothetical protein